MELTTEQILLLNNLMYMDGSGDDNPLAKADQYEGQTVREWMESIDVSQLEDDKNYGSYITGKDWKNIIGSVKSDDTLMNMTVATTHTDWAEGGGGGYSAVFLSKETDNAVVAFRGTAAQEWQDDFTGGNVVETPQQKNALAWYQDVYKEYGLSDYEVTVTGHSKGGNKSKYITLLDDTVDHCVSFDGQGFSDKFINEYADQIAANQGKIQNHNVDYDYVNILLNDVGEKTYYVGQDLGEGGFLENHCPNTYMKYDENGQFVIEINPDGQGKEMQSLDNFLNSYLRSMSDEDRSQALEIINLFLDDENTAGKEITDIFMETITDPKYSDDVAYLLAYTIKYEQEHPEFAGEIGDVLEKFGMGDYVKYVDIATSVLNYEEDIHIGPFTWHVDFNTLLGIINGTLGIVGGGLDFQSGLFGNEYDSEWALRKLCDLIEDQTGIRLTPKELRELLGILEMVHDDLDDIKIKDNGGDLKIKSRRGGGSEGRSCRIKCDLPGMRRSAKNLEGLQTLLSQLSDEIESVANSLSFHMASATSVKRSLLAVSSEVRKRATAAERLSQALMTIAEQYESTENKNVTILS